jgi:hypothetical protein
MRLHMILRSMSQQGFLDQKQRDIAVTELKQGTVDRIEISASVPISPSLAPQVAAFVRSGIVQRPFSGLERLNRPIGKLQLDLSMKPLLVREATNVGVDISPVFRTLTTQRQVKDKTVLEGMLFGAAASCIWNACAKSCDPIFLTLGLVMAGGVIWPHVTSLEITYNPDGSVSGRLGL